MSDAPASAPAAPHPPAVGEPGAGSYWTSFLAILGCFALFAILLALAYQPPGPAAPDLTGVDEADQWKYFPEQRAARRAEVEGAARQAASAYARDPATNAVRIPLDRAMSLVVAEKDPRAAPADPAPAPAP